MIGRIFLLFDFCYIQFISKTFLYYVSNDAIKTNDEIIKHEEGKINII